MRALYDLPAPAKLNVFLHITGRRADGYHLLQSIFMLIDWCDTLHVEARGDGELTREDLGTPLPPDDLVLRAARTLQRLAPSGSGAHIAINKQIPSEAGMGGGSSDAATTLLALNRLWGLKLPLSELEKLGLTLGADVPFFLRGHNALVEGIGEQITPLQLPAARFVVAKPPQGLQTARIFNSRDMRRDTAPIPPAIISGFAANAAAHVHDFVYDFGHNDLQPVAQQLCPAVGDAIQWLADQGLKGRMTGSGSAVFAQIPHDKALEELRGIPMNWQVRKCGNLAVHPLVGWAV